MENTLYVNWETSTPLTNPIKNHSVVVAEQVTPHRRNGRRNAQPSRKTAINVERVATLDEYVAPQIRVRNKLQEQKISRIRLTNPRRNPVQSRKK